MNLNQTNECFFHLLFQGTSRKPPICVGHKESSGWDCQRNETALEIQKILGSFCDAERSKLSVVQKVWMTQSPPNSTTEPNETLQDSRVAPGSTDALLTLDDEGEHECCYLLAEILRDVSHFRTRR